MMCGGWKGRKCGKGGKGMWKRGGEGYGKVGEKIEGITKGASDDVCGRGGVKGIWKMMYDERRIIVKMLF
jgi:hypothetical protein